MSNVQDKAGKYHIVYEIVNSRGYKSIITREVIVVDESANLNVYTDLYPNVATSGNVEIIISITGTDYDYTILPNGENNSNKSIQYTVSENGVYAFKMMSKSGNIITKEIEVDNIDRSIPEASCTAIMQNDGTKIEVKSELSKSYSYDYIINNQESGYKVSQTYRSGNTNVSTAQVKISDALGNENTIICDIVDQRLNYNVNGYTTEIRSSNRIHEPIAQALARKGYTVYDFNSCIYNRVLKVGPGTRYGVVEAAYGLIDCSIKMMGGVLPCNHESGKVEGEYCEFNSDICGKLGVNTRWGSEGGACAEGQPKCWHGMNCATFVGWSMCNGGMDMCTKRSAGAWSMVNKSYFPDADGVLITGSKVEYHSGKDLTGYDARTLVRMIQPGDVVARVDTAYSSGSYHAFVIVGKDETGLYTANDGYYMDKVSYSSMTNGDMIYKILFLDNYYANANNKNHLYPE